MALFKRLFYRKPPDGLLEISERVFVFDCCFTADIMDDDDYKVYVGGIVAQLHEYYTDASFMAFNFREGDKQSYLAKILSEYDMTVMDYPRLYETCPLLTMEMVHHFLRSCESWLLLGQRNVLLMHCERGGWPILAFMLAAMLIYRKQYTGEQKTLDMIYKQAPRELLQLMSPLNPLPSQLRYLQYISRRNVGSEWPPIDRALTMDCIILRFIPNMDGEGGCRPVFRIYGPDPLMVADRTPKVLFSTSKRSKVVRHYKQADCQLVKIDINCHVQGDVVLECISLDDDLEHEKMMFRVMFNTAFIRSNILMLNRDEVDLSWDGKECFPKDFRAEVIFSEMDSTSSAVTHDVPSIEENEGLPIEAFAKVKEIFSTVDWLETRKDVALTVLQRITSANLLQEKLDSGFLECSPRISANNNLLHKHLAKETDESLPMHLEDNISTSPSLSLGELSSPSPERSADLKSLYKKNEFRGLQISVQNPNQPKIVSQRALQTSPSTPTLNISSPQASAMSISRFHSAPSFLGITALLHDHAEPKAKEFCVPVITTPVAAVSSLEHVYSPVQSAVNSNLESSQSPSSLLLSEARTRTADIIPPLTPTSLSRSPPIVSEISTTVKSSATPSPPPPPPPLPPSFVKSSSSLSSKNSDSSTTLAPPSSYEAYPSATVRKSIPLPPPLPTSSNVVLSRPTNNVSSIPSPPPLPPVRSPGVVPSTFLPSRAMTCPPPPPPPPPPCLEPAGPTKCTAPAPPPPPAPKFGSKGAMDSPNVPPVPPPPAPSFASKGPLDKNSPHVPPVPPPPAPASNGLLKSGGTASSNGNIPPIPGPPLNANGRLNLRAGVKNPGQSSKKSNLKPYHWLKLTRAMQGSLWAEAQKSDEASKAPEFDMSELETLFSVNVPNSDLGSRGKSNRRASATKPEKVSLVDFRRAYNCEIMLSKIKIPLPDMMSAVLALDDSVLDIDQVENLIKYCPTKEEMELLKNYKGDKENLGKCEQFFFELMKVPRVEAKLRVFAFKIQFCSQVSDLRKSLNVVNCTSEEVRNSVKLKRIMQTILSLGNALNHGTARGSAVGFRLDSLLKLTDTRARNNKLTLMHYLCKVLAEKLPELLDFHKDLVSLEGSTKIQLKYLAEEMQAISKGLEKIVQELIASENDGPVSETFCQILKEFLGYAEAEVRSLASLYSIVGKNADALALYFGEDPARCPFEQVVSTLRNFVRMFVRAHEENCKQLEFEKKKALKEGENEKGNSSTPRKRPDMEPMKSNECAEHLLKT